MNFTPQSTAGTYTLVLGPGIADASGNWLDRDGDGVRAEPIDDRITINGSFMQGLGDINGDRVVDQQDLTLVAGHFGLRTADPGWDARADTNLDGVINAVDQANVIANLGKRY